MGTKIVYSYLDETHNVLSIEQIVTNIKNLKISNISLSEDSYFRKDDDNIVIFKDTDYDHPIVLETNSFDDNITILINPEWYKDNHQLVDQLICFISENVETKKLDINNSCLVSDKVIESLCKNKSLENVNLSKYKENGYVLKYEDYLKFKSSTIKKVGSFSVDEKLKENFDLIIGYNADKNLIGLEKYKDLVSNEIKILFLDDSVKIEQLENLKYISSNKEIIISENFCFNFKVVKSKLKEFNKNNKIVLNIYDKNKFNDFIFSNEITDDNIFVRAGFIELPLKEYLKFEKLLYLMIEPAKDLSPFEKYIYVYNITKQFKKYKENPNEKSDSRNLYSILVNEYMVCVGYSDLFGDLLDKLGINSKDLGVTIDVSYDNIKTNQSVQPEEIIVQKGYHARRYVHIIDDKYGINGFYVADPTWDNDLENDYYNHLAMTDNEVSNSNRYLWIDSNDSLYAYELLNVNDIQEFYQKLNFILDRCKEGYSLEFVTCDLMDIIKDIDSNFYKLIQEKYKFISDFNWPNDISDLIYDLANYITSHVNKPISGDTIMKGVEEVYKHSYGYSEEQLQTKLIEIRRLNKERQDRAFPKRYKEYNDGRMEPYINESNKFDIEESSMVK